MRVNKLLSNYGYCSRKEVRKLIEEERIVINGELAIQGQWVEECDDILLDGERVRKKESIYIALNKPRGITCTAANEVKDNIINYINYNEYVFPIGRLDKESQGLILITNDGELANKIIASENEHEKEYIVTVDKVIDWSFIEKMSNGVEILGVITKKCKVDKIDDFTFRIVLTQGLNRQIRRMSKQLGYTVKKLERIRIMNISIDNIEYGKWRYLNKDEIEVLMKKA